MNYKTGMMRPDKKRYHDSLLTKKENEKAQNTDSNSKKEKKSLKPLINLENVSHILGLSL